MTINHLFVYVTAQRMAAMRAFYKDALKPLGYNEMICANGEKTLGFGSDYPYVWLQQVPDGHEPYPTHIAIDAPGMSFVVVRYGSLLTATDNHAVDEFHRIAL
jgi:hypothetical protein